MFNPRLGYYLAHYIIQVCSSSDRTSRLDKNSMQRPRKEYLVLVEGTTGDYWKLLEITTDCCRIQMRSKSKGFN